MRVVEKIPDDWFNVFDLNSIFTEDDRAVIKNNKTKEIIKIGSPSQHCSKNLFMGFFFDGTGNNYTACDRAKDEAYSNVARLYDAYPGRSVAGVLSPQTDWKHQKEQFEHFFRVYIPGLGTTFDEVEDSGEGLDRVFGAAGGAKGERRIIWALAQAMNCLHRFFKANKYLFERDDIKKLWNDWELGWREMLADAYRSYDSDQNKEVTNIKADMQTLLKKLHAAIGPHMYMPGEQPQKTDPTKVEKIYVSAFGFSRGATEARVFTNWFMALCREDAKMLKRPCKYSLGGFEVCFDFLGVFDTVASVGMASALLVPDGHAAWADAEHSLRIHPDIGKCLHLVAMHEVRRSFPLDSVATNKGGLGANCEEIMFPGVHSDVGGGYSPKEQGKGTDSQGNDLLFRLPLIYMYRQARLNGVPFKPELMAPDFRYRFKTTQQTIQDFNAYLSAVDSHPMPTIRVGGGKSNDDEIVVDNPFKAQLVKHCLPHMDWRMTWVNAESDAAIAQLVPDIGRATQFEKNYLRGANVRFKDELEAFTDWVKKRKTDTPGIDSGRDRDWHDLRAWWKHRKPGVAPAIHRFFSFYSHDSWAGFRPTGGDEQDMKKKLERLVYRMKREQSLPDSYKGAKLTPGQIEIAKNYDREGKWPSEAYGDYESSFVGAGYLRFRKTYAGSDTLTLSQNWRNLQHRAQETVLAAADNLGKQVGSPEVRNTVAKTLQRIV